MNGLPSRVLLTTDGSECALLAMRAGADLALKSGAELHVAHVWRDVPSPYARAFIKQELQHQGQEILDEGVATLEESGVTVAGSHLAGGRVSDEVLSLVERVDADLLVLGSRGHGPIGRLLLGSHAEDIVHYATRPVIVVRQGEGENWPPERVILCDDLSAEAENAARMGMHVAALYGAAVTLFHAYPPREAGITEYPAEEATRDLEARARKLEEAGGAKPETMLWEGDVTQGVTEIASENPGNTLIVVGSRGLGAIDRVRLGSTSTKVVRAAPCPVLVYPRADRGLRNTG